MCGRRGVDEGKQCCLCGRVLFGPEGDELGARGEDVRGA
jgi:hypothetical protein